MIISDFYQTKIEASSYNVNIDATDTVITVSLIDFNGAAVTGKQVVLTCDKGYFNKNGSTTISGTDTKSITATTDSNGKITATWTASEWGLATFSTNNINTQIHVNGWKQISVTAGTLYVNGEQRLATYSYSGSGISKDTVIVTIPSGYRTIAPFMVRGHNYNQVLPYFSADGKVTAYMRDVSSSSVTIGVTYHY